MMPVHRVIIVAGLFGWCLAPGGSVLLAQAGEVPEMQSKPLTRAIYGFRSGSELFAGKTPGEMAKQLLAWGCNAVFLKDEPGELMRALQEHGIRCYQEIGLFQGCNHWQKHPESRPIQADGTPLEKEEWYCGVCPNQEWLQQEKLEEIEKVVATPGMDGIWLDFIRYPVHWESPEPRLPLSCFCPLCLERFSADAEIGLPTGESAVRSASFILENHSDAWYQWRADQITDFVRRAAERAKSKNPEFLVGLFAVPSFGGAGAGELRKVVGQDFTALAPHVDVFSPMVYHRMCGRSTEWISASVEQMSRETQKPVWPIIQACSVPDALSGEEFQDAIRKAQLQPSEGVIIFSLGHLVKEKRLESLAEAWVEPPVARK